MTDTHDAVPAATPQGLRRWAMLCVGWCVLLLLFGANVNTQDGGLTVPDWPRMYYEWVPGWDRFWQFMGPAPLRAEVLHRYVAQVMGILTIVLAVWEGYKVDELRVRHFKRKYGRSKYGGSRFLNGIFDLITVMFITRRALNPLHFFGRISFVLFVLGAAPQLYFLFLWIGGEGLRVRPIMLAGFVLIIVSLQIASIGLLAEMISARSGREPNYVFKEYLVGHSDSRTGGSEETS